MEMLNTALCGRTKVLVFVLLVALFLAPVGCFPQGWDMSTPLIKYSVSIATTSATVNATVAVKSGMALIDIYKNAARATVAYIATLTFNKNGNLKFTSTTQVLNDVWDVTEWTYDKQRQRWINSTWKNND